MQKVVQHINFPRILPCDLNCVNKPQQIVFHIEMAGALNLEQKKLCFKDDGKKNSKSDIWCFGIFLTTITIVITIVSRPEFLLFKV